MRSRRVGHRTKQYKMGHLFFGRIEGQGAICGGGGGRCPSRGGIAGRGGSGAATEVAKPQTAEDSSEFLVSRSGASGDHRRPHHPDQTHVTRRKRKRVKRQSTKGYSKSRQTRNPTTTLRVPGATPSRSAERQYSGVPPHEPPRKTRDEAPSSPSGFAVSCVGYSA